MCRPWVPWHLWFMHAFRLLRSLSAYMLTLAILATACGGSGDVEPESTFLCPTCAPRGGGETADFPSSGSTPCVSVMKGVMVSESEAAALPFLDLALLKARIEAPIDASLRWTVGKVNEWDTIKYSKVLGGYDSETRLHLTTRVTGYRHFFPDPELCDGTMCPDGDHWFDQRECYDYLELTVESSVKTDDDALMGELAGEAVITGPSLHFASNVDEVMVRTIADLTTIRGRLKLDAVDLDPARGYLSIKGMISPSGVDARIYATLVFEEITEGAVTVDGHPAPLVMQVPETPFWAHFVAGDPSAFDLPGAVIPNSAEP